MNDSLWNSALYLEKGHLFEGNGFGAKLSSGGEIIFNTGMSGYQEIFTDPSYSRQVLVMGYPHIGNTGINEEDWESRGLFLSGLVTREVSLNASSWRSRLTLPEYLANHHIPGISDVDTREITRIIRDEGAQRAVIFPVENPGSTKELLASGKTLLEKVEPMEGLELVSQVSCKKPYEFEPSEKAEPCSVVVYDFGVKHNILRHFKKHGFRVWVVPYNTPAEEVLAYSPVGLVLSNGPGDPAKVPQSAGEIQRLVGKLPILAICMGHQLLARALGANTYKLKFGHHGINHPVIDKGSKRILITSQNHGFAVHEKDLIQEDVVVSHMSLNDHTVEGFCSEKMRFISVQFHPEAAPGPTDASYLFDSFVRGFLQ
ncbi:MAG: glutamine-hydrolyzing carbamoyl-phosphate synthase small subunit [Deltaproteobacteria bacterium]|nr:glutamine-hydrolyzing carbamoyl-phosphate synthase small subunit [Deltaproteobacteria bacterium]